MRVVRLVALLLLFVFLSNLLALAQRSSTDAFMLSIERIKRSVVPILCGQVDQRGQFSVQLIDGTGFFVDEQHFLTAAHVINDLKTVNPKRSVPCVMAIYVPLNGWEREAINFDAQWFKFTDCAIDDALDVAVCNPVIKITAKVYPLAFRDFRPPDGSPVAFTGFPLGSIEPLSSRCNISTYRNVIDTEGSRQVMLDKGTWPGASGSPIYDSTGRVLGIMLARGIDDSTGTAFGLPSHFIIMFLRSHGIGGRNETGKEKK